MVCIVLSFCSMLRKGQRVSELLEFTKMGDVYDAKTRRRVMQSIRKTDTKPERLVRSVLHKMGFRFRLYRRDLPGVPDVLPRHGVVVFVHGCFWHQHTCSLGKLPKSNRPYWVPKLRGNKRRDHANEQALREEGWDVVTIWECEATDEATVRKLLRMRLPPRMMRATRKASVKREPAEGPD